MRKTVRRGGVKVAIGALLIAGAAAIVRGAAYEASSAATGPGTPKTLNCGDIHGKIGRIDDWLIIPAVAGSHATAQTCNGNYGGAWADPTPEHQFPVIQPASDNHTDTLLHKYAKVAQGSPINLYLKVDCTSTPKLSGSSSIWDPPSSSTWWWTCACNVAQAVPQSRFRIGSNPWQTPTFTADGDNTNDTGSTHSTEFQGTDNADVPVTIPPTTVPYPVPGGQPHFPPNAPKDPAHPTTLQRATNYPKSTSGYSPANDVHGVPVGGGDYHAKTPDKLPTATSEVEVSVQLNVDATVSCDNAEVTAWRVLLIVNFSSAMTVTKP